MVTIAGTELGRGQEPGTPFRSQYTGGKDTSMGAIIYSPGLLEGSQAEME